MFFKSNAKAITSTIFCVQNCAKQRALHRPKMTDVFKELESFRMVMEEQARARSKGKLPFVKHCSSAHVLFLEFGKLLI